MDTCYPGPCYRQFRRAYFIEIVDFSTKSSLVYQKWFFLVALLAFEKHFHLGRTQVIKLYNDAELILDENKRSVHSGAPNEKL